MTRAAVCQVLTCACLFSSRLWRRFVLSGRAREAKGGQRRQQRLPASPDMRCAVRHGPGAGAEDSSPGGKRRPKRGAVGRAGAGARWVRGGHAQWVNRMTWRSLPTLRRSFNACGRSRLAWTPPRRQSQRPRMRCPQPSPLVPSKVKHHHCDEYTVYCQARVPRLPLPAGWPIQLAPHSGRAFQFITWKPMSLVASMYACTCCSHGRGGGGSGHR